MSLDLGIGNDAMFRKAAALSDDALVREHANVSCAWQRHENKYGITRRFAKREWLACLCNEKARRSAWKSAQKASV